MDGKEGPVSEKGMGPGGLLTVTGGLAMSCDRESFTSCQDLLAMSRTVLGTPEIHLVSAFAGSSRVESGGNRLRRRPLARAVA